MGEGGVGWVRVGEGCSNDYHGIGRGGETGGCGLWSQGGVWVGGGWLGLQVKDFVAYTLRDFVALLVLFHVK